MRPPKECPHERTIASSRKAPLGKKGDYSIIYSSFINQAIR